MDTRISTTHLEEDNTIPSFNYSSIHNILIEYRKPGGYLYHAALLVRAPYTRTPEEIALENILYSLSKNRKSDELTSEEILKLVEFSYMNLEHPLCQRVTNLFYKINGIGRHFDLLNLYREKKLLTPDSLWFLLSCNSKIKAPLFSLITEWNIDGLSLTQTIIEYATLFMLAAPNMNYLKIIEMFAKLNAADLLTLETISVIANHYSNHLETIVSLLSCVHEYNIAHRDHPCDIDLPFFLKIKKTELDNLLLLFEALVPVNSLNQGVVLTLLKGLPEVPSESPIELIYAEHEILNLDVPEAPPLPPVSTSSSKSNVNNRNSVVTNKNIVTTNRDNCSFNNELLTAIKRHGEKKEQANDPTVAASPDDYILDHGTNVPSIKEKRTVTNKTDSFNDQLKQAINDYNARKARGEIKKINFTTTKKPEVTAANTPETLFGALKNRLDSMNASIHTPPESDSDEDRTYRW